MFIADVIRHYLGWCPGSGEFQVQKRAKIRRVMHCGDGTGSRNAA